jgi:TonB family protein
MPPVGRHETPPLQANAMSAEPLLPAEIMVETELARRQPAAILESTVDPSSTAGLPRTQHVARASTVNANRAEGIQSRTTSASAASAGSSGVLSVPSPIYKPAPIYPPELEAAGIEGLVKLRVELSGEGRVISAKVVKTSGYNAFDKSALAIIYRWRFTASTARAPSQRELIVPIRFGFGRN